MKQLWRRLLRDEAAMTFVEYGLLVGALGLSIVFGMQAFTNQLYRLWHTIENASNNAQNRH